MRKIFLFIFFISIYFIGKSQYAPTSSKTRFVNGIGLSTKDTASLSNAGDTLAMIVGKDSLVYFKYKGYWKPIAYNSSLGFYVKYTDTSLMLSPYQRGYSAMKYTDTANMLSPYYRTAQATAALALKLNISDTAAMLSGYARTGSYKLANDSLFNTGYTTRGRTKQYGDSIAALKVNYTDTATMLSNYYNKTVTNYLLSSKLNIADTSSMLSGYKTYYPRNAISGGTGISYNPSTGVITSSGGTVTSITTNYGLLGGTITTSGTISADSSLLSTKLWRQKGIDSVQANVNLRVKYTDTASMLSPYQKTANAITSVGLSMPVAFTVSNTPLTSNGTIAVTGAGTASQYIRGDGQLATYSNGGGGGGASVNYYLNGGTAASVSTYYQMSNTAVVSTAVDFSTGTTGLISQFLTDAGNPNSLTIPAGAWNFQLYFSASSAGGTPTYYVELYKYSVGGTFTLIATNSGTPDGITAGTTTELYISNLAVPTTTLLSTDRLAVRIYVSTSGRTITLHTQDSHLCKITTTFSGGISALNGLTAGTQYFATGTSGTDFAVSSLTDTHTFNLPTASATNRGALSSANWTTFNSKISPSDTATMLSPYLRSTNYGLLKSSQTVSADSSLLSTKLWRQKGIDSVSANVNLRVKYTDTATMLTPYKASYYTINQSSDSSYFTIKSLSGSQIDTVKLVYSALSGGGGSASGTINYISKFTSTTALGNSSIFDNGTSIGINNITPSASAKLEVASTTQGFLMPRMTSTQRTAITSPAEGLLVIQTDGTMGLYLYINSAWHAIIML